LPMHQVTLPDALSAIAGVIGLPPLILTPPELLLLPQPAASTAMHATIAPEHASFVCSILLLDVCFPQ
jgi:hypothetical protein